MYAPAVLPPPPPPPPRGVVLPLTPLTNFARIESKVTTPLLLLVVLLLLLGLRASPGRDNRRLAWGRGVVVVGGCNGGGETRDIAWSSGSRLEVVMEDGEVLVPSLSMGESSSSPLLLPEGEVKKPSSAKASSSSLRRMVAGLTFVRGVFGTGGGSLKVTWMPSSKEEAEAEEEKEGGTLGTVLLVLLVVVAVVVVTVLVEAIGMAADSDRECCKATGERGGLEGGGERIDEEGDEEAEEDAKEEEEERSGVSAVERVKARL